MSDEGYPHFRSRQLETCTLECLCGSYRHSPFFDYYADEFHRFFEERYTWLYDFNAELCSWVCEQIDLQPRIIPTDDYLPVSETADDFRERIHPKRLPQEADLDFVPKAYYQVFDARLGFLPNLSIVDLLFNMGPESLLVLRDSTVGSSQSSR